MSEPATYRRFLVLAEPDAATGLHWLRILSAEPMIFAGAGEPVLAFIAIQSDADAAGILQRLVDELVAGRRRWGQLRAVDPDPEDAA